jgi:hypothetical protein
MGKGIALFIILILFLGIGLLIFFGYQKGWKFFGSNDEEEIKQVQLRLKAIDSDSEGSIDSSLSIYQNNNLVKSIELKKDTLELVNLQANQSYKFLTSKDGYYSRTKQMFLAYDNIDYVLLLKKFYEPIVLFDGELKNGDSNITFNLTSENFHSLVVCTEWTAGLYYARINQNESQIPKRYFRKVDKCYDFNKTLTRDSMEFVVETKGFDIQSNDYVRIYIIDKDIIFNGDFIESFEKDGEDVALKDIKIEVR